MKKVGAFSRVSLLAISVLIETAAIPLLAQADNQPIFTADHCNQGDPLCVESDKPLRAPPQSQPSNASVHKETEAKPPMPSEQSQATRMQTPDQRGAPIAHTATNPTAAQTKNTADGYEYDFNDDHGDGKRLKSEDVLKLRRHDFDFVVVPSLDCQLPKELTDQYPTLHGVSFDRSVCVVKKPVVVEPAPVIKINPMAPQFRVQMDTTRSYDTGGTSSVNGVFPNSAIVNTGTASAHLTIPTSKSSGLNISAGGGITDSGSPRLAPIMSELNVEYYGDVGDMNHKPVMVYGHVGQDPAHGIDQEKSAGAAFEGGWGQGYRDVTHTAYLAPGDGFSYAGVYSIDVGTRSYSAWTGIPSDGIDLSLLNLVQSAQYCAPIGAADKVLLCPRAGATVRLGGQLTDGPAGAGAGASSDSSIVVTGQLQAGLNLAYVDERAQTGEIKRYFYVGPTAEGQSTFSPQGSVNTWQVGATAGMANF